MAGGSLYSRLSLTFIPLSPYGLSIQNDLLASRRCEPLPPRLTILFWGNYFSILDPRLRCANSIFGLLWCLVWIKRRPTPLGSFSLVSMIRASTLNPQCPPSRSQLFTQTSNKLHPILHQCPPLSPLHSVEKANEVWSTSAFSSIFLRLRIQDDLPPTSFLTGGSHVVAFIYRSLALSTFVIF